MQEKRKHTKLPIKILKKNKAQKSKTNKFKFLSKFHVHSILAIQQNSPVTIWDWYFEEKTSNEHIDHKWICKINKNKSMWKLKLANEKLSMALLTKKAI